MQRTVVLGAGGHARVVLDILERAGRVQVIGVLAPAGEALGRYPVLGPDERLAELVGHSAVIGIGDNWTRSIVAAAASRFSPALRFETAVHPGAHVAEDVALGEGTVVMAGAVINPGARVGRHCIVNSGAIVEHDVVLGDFASLGPRAVVGGGTRVGAYSAIAIGATVLHGLEIGEHTVIGAGAAVVASVTARVVAFGVPCRVVRARSPGEEYL